MIIYIVVWKFSICRNSELKESILCATKNKETAEWLVKLHNERKKTFFYDEYIIEEFCLLD